MSDTSQQQAAAPQGTAELSFLDRAVQATVQTPADTTRDLMTALTRQAMAGTVSWDKNLTLTLRKAITLIDKQISSQLSEVMTAPDFRRLEGSWLGLHKLVRESDPGADLKIRMADYTKSELLQQFENAPQLTAARFLTVCIRQNSVPQAASRTACCSGILSLVTVMRMWRCCVTSARWPAPLMRRLWPPPGGQCLIFSR